MDPTLVDTDILSYFLRGDPPVVAAFDRYLSQHGKIIISIITYYEVLSGLRYRDAKKLAGDFLELADSSRILPLTIRACSIAADLYADLRQNGQRIDDVDQLIASIALAKDLPIATNNVRHFEQVPGLRISDWKATDLE